MFPATVSGNAGNRCVFGLFISWNTINQGIEAAVIQQVGQATPCSPLASDLTDFESISLCPHSLLFEGKKRKEWGNAQSFSMFMTY